MPIYAFTNLKHVTRREWAYYKQPCVREECSGKYFIIYNDMTCHACGHQTPRPLDAHRQPKPRKDYKRTSKNAGYGSDTL